MNAGFQGICGMSGNIFQDVYWVADGVGDNFSAHLASRRYTAIIPAQLLGGHVVAYDPEAMAPDEFLDRYKPRTLIFTKAFDWRFVELTKAAQKSGIKAMATVVDWHFERDYNRALFEISDQLVVQTAEMAKTVEDIIGRKPVIIEEPYEGRRNSPRFSPGEVVKLLWYGSNNNLDGLEHCMHQLARLEGYRFRLVVVCETPSAAQETLSRIPEAHSEIKCLIGQWTPDFQDQATEDADLILIPNINAKEKRVKGHNRLVAAIHGGRLALASPLPQYLELKDFCWCGEDMAEGIEWAREHGLEAETRIKKGQQYIDKRFSPNAVAARWAEEIQSLLAA